MSSRPRNSGFTLAEVMIAMGLGSLVMGALLAASISVQKSTAAAQAYTTAKADQMRISGHIARDARRALDAVATSNASITTIIEGTPSNATTTATVPSLLTLKLPDYLLNGVPRDPVFTDDNAITYGPNPQTIRYFQIGNAFYREEAGVARAIARNVGSFTVTEYDLTTLVRCEISFLPSFTFNPSDAARANTTIKVTTFFRNAACWHGPAS